jgi:endothelin-converting enzyme
MAEKTPLIAPVTTPRQSGQYVQRCSKGRALGKLLLIAAAASIVYYGAPQGSFSDIDVEKKPELCLTPACVHAASEILYNLSPQYKELDACDNFEELVCGGWRDRHDLRADQGDAFTGTIMSENSQMLLRHILEAPYPKDSSVCTFMCKSRCFDIDRCIAFLLLTHATSNYSEICR